MHREESAEVGIGELGGARVWGGAQSPIGRGKKEGWVGHSLRAERLPFLLCAVGATEGF